MKQQLTTLKMLFHQKVFPDYSFFIHKVFEGRKIIVYGAGECCHWFVEVVIRLHGYWPTVVLDKKFSAGGKYEGIPAYAPHDYQPTEDEKRDAIVVICVGKEEYYDEIVSTLKEIGYENIMLLRDVYEIHNPFDLPPELGELGFDYYLQKKEEILSCFDLFADDTSREIFSRCLQTHMERKPLALPKRPREEQFFPKDIKLSRGYSRFINCGSDTDIFRLLNENAGKVDAIACFEPDPQLFNIVSDYLWRQKDRLADNIITFPCAAYNTEAVMNFTSANSWQHRVTPTGFGSMIKEDGELKIQCVSLDHVLPGFKPTFICMDIEAAELEALRGAEKLLRAHRPDLAICVYHAPSHIWEIPLFLHCLGLGYQFYLRNHTTFNMETVLYAAT
jgi:FkbM family methyltransferase